MSRFILRKVDNPPRERKRICEDVKKQRVLFYRKSNGYFSFPFYNFDTLYTTAVERGRKIINIINILYTYIHI